MVETMCLVCGGEIKKYPSQRATGRGKYCSKKCAGISLSSQTKITITNCLNCGKSFSVKTKRFEKGEGKCCSWECRQIYRKKKPRFAFTCLHCGKKFSDKPSTDRKYCSATCFGLDNRGANNYKWIGGTVVYVGGWCTQRKKARERDGGVCQMCHRKPRKGERNFPVHHIVKARHFKDNPTAANELSNLITLCPQCHPKAENGRLPVPARLF